MPSKQLLNTHPLPSLKREIRKTNITGYSKLTKDEIIELMLKHKDRFHHMTDYVKPERKPRKPRVKKEKVVEEKKENKEDILDKKLDKLHENLNNTEFPSLEILNETARTLMDYRDLGGNKHKGLVKLIYKRQKATIAKSKEKKPDNKRKLIIKTINYDKPSKDVVIKSVSKAKEENKKIVIKKEEQSKGTAKKVSKIQQPKQMAKVIKPKEKRQPLTNAKVIKAEPKEENFKQPIKGNMTKEQVLKDLKEYGEKIGREMIKTSTIGRDNEGLENFLNTYNIDYIDYKGGDKAGVRADTIEIWAITQPTMEYHQRFKVLFVKKKEEKKKKEPKEEPKKKEPKKKEEPKKLKEISKPLEEVWAEYMSEKAGSFGKKISVQQDELEELIELDKKYKQYEKERKDTDNSAKIQLNAIGEQNEIIEDIRTNITDENPNLLKVYKKFAPTIFNVITKQLKSEE